MPKDKLVLIDTSIWIDYFSGKNQRVTEVVDDLLSNTRVATAGIILAELAQGARTTTESQSIRTHFQPLHWITSEDSHWETAGHLSWKLRRAAKTVNLTDCYIASLSVSAAASIYTLDKHFHWIADVSGCTLFQP
jgi:predicted nucleic acid-binding protein